MRQGEALLIQATLQENPFSAKNAMNGLPDRVKKR
jgi:hypothetical protein